MNKRQTFIERWKRERGPEMIAKMEREFRDSVSAELADQLTTRQAEFEWARDRVHAELPTVTSTNRAWVGSGVYAKGVRITIGTTTSTLSVKEATELRHALVRYLDNGARLTAYRLTEEELLTHLRAYGEEDPEDLANEVRDARPAYVDMSPGGSASYDGEGFYWVRTDDLRVRL